MQNRDRALLLAAVMSLALAGCDRGGTASRDAAPGATGRSSETAQRDRAAQPGTGLQGGLGTNSMGAASSPTGSAGVPSGSKNRTTGGSVGNR
jgi:hypothetical protein